MLQAVDGRCWTATKQDEHPGEINGRYFIVMTRMPSRPLSEGDLRERFRRKPASGCENEENVCPPGSPYVFTHGDLTSVNIMGENENLIGIID